MTKPYRVHAARWASTWLFVAACTEGTCPEGSVAMGDQCVPLSACPTGQERIDGECRSPDAGGTGAGGTGGSGGAGSAGSGGNRASNAGTSSTPSAGAGGAGGSAAPAPGPCEDLDCGAHGECVADGDKATCACSEGYEGEHCDGCAPGLGPSGSGECVPLCEAENAPDCGEFGHCVADDQTATCECEHPRGGALCDGCAEGYALAEDECVPDCGDCGPHSLCDATPLIPVCGCVAGYRREDQCEWVGDGETGGVVNGGFLNGDGWMVRHVTIANNTATFGSDGSGMGCELGVLSQTLKMPKRMDAEPLVLEIDALSTCTQPDPAGCPPLLVEIGKSVTRVLVPGGASPSQRTLALCLGEAGYGEEVPLRIRPGLATQAPNAVFRCGVDSWPSLKGVRVRVAQTNECPPASGIWNGDFAESNGWDFEPGADISNGALELHPTALASTKVAFPLPFSVPSPALRFSKTAGDVAIRLDGLDWTALLESAASSTGAQTICMPDFALGAVHQLDFFGDAKLSTMSIVTSPSCDENRFDAGFERPLSTGSWFQQGDAEVVSSSQAHGGNHIARIETQTTLRTLARFPEPVAAGDGHAALRVWRRLEAANQSGTYHLIAFGPTPGGAPVDNVAWKVDITCPGRAWNGQLASLFVQVVPGDNSRIFFDDAGPGLSTECN